MNLESVVASVATGESHGPVVESPTEPKYSRETTLRNRQTSPENGHPSAK